MRAFLVTFPKKESASNPFQNSYPQPYPDNRPTLVIAESISDVASKNKMAIEIKEMDVSNVIVPADCCTHTSIYYECPFKEKK